MNFDLSFKAYLLNQKHMVPRKERDNSFAVDNRNALKLSDEKVDELIYEIERNPGIPLKEACQIVGITCSMNNVRARLIARNFDWKK